MKEHSFVREPKFDSFLYNWMLQIIVSAFQHDYVLMCQPLKPIVLKVTALYISTVFLHHHSVFYTLRIFSTNEMFIKVLVMAIQCINLLDKHSGDNNP